jgi:O-succinylbenzoate synthase
LVKLPIRHRFASAATSQTERRVVIVRLESEALAGWGEAAPFAGHTTDTPESVWSQLREGSPAEGLALAAMNQARTDLEAKRSGKPLARFLGGGAPTTASVAIGLDDRGQPDTGQIEQAVDAGYQAAKLKVGPDTNPSELLRIAAAHPSLALGLDANGSLGLQPSPLISAADEGGFAYLEQPGPADDIDGHARLAERTQIPIVLDESIATPQTLEAVIATGGRVALNLKAGRYGTAEAFRYARAAVSAGIAVRVGGLLETGIGRSHSVALASCSEFTMVGDVAASTSYFDDDLVHPMWDLHEGHLVPTEAPGIGVEVDIDKIDALAQDRFSAPL